MATSDSGQHSVELAIGWEQYQVEGIFKTIYMLSNMDHQECNSRRPKFRIFRKDIDFQYET